MSDTPLVRLACMVFFSSCFSYGNPVVNFEPKCQGRDLMTLASKVSDQLIPKQKVDVLDARTWEMV